MDQRRKPRGADSPVPFDISVQNQRRRGTCQPVDRIQKIPIRHLPGNRQMQFHSRYKVRNGRQCIDLTGIPAA